VGAAALFFGLLAACQLVIGLEEPKGVDAPIDDGGADSGGDPCKHEVPPPKPTKDDNPEVNKTYWLAASHVTVPLKPTASGYKPGFDLDNACTCSPDLHDGGPPCSTPGTTNCDFDGGVDDAFGATFDTFAASSGLGGLDLVAPVNNELASGTRTLLFYITGYNDSANDSEVSVQFVNSGGLYTNVDCDGNPRPDEKVTFDDPSLGNPKPLPDKRYAPLNDGCDHWSPDEGATTAPNAPIAPQQTLKAYVNNYDLVVQFDTLAAALFGQTSTVTNGVAAAHLTKVNGKLHASGVVSGRMAFDGLMDLVGRTSTAIGADSGSMPFCQSQFWLLVGPRFCSARDTMAMPSLEFKGKTCDAASATIGFDFVEAQVSPVAFTNTQDTADCSSAPKITCPQ
jgi:hypothetical protein